MTLDIGGTAYELSVPLDPGDSGGNSESIETVARNFCQAHTEEFQLNDSNVVEYCVEPVSTYLQKAVEEAATTAPSPDPTVADSAESSTATASEEEIEDALIEI